jgi:hypothetical protein
MGIFSNHFLTEWTMQNPTLPDTFSFNSSNKPLQLLTSFKKAVNRGKSSKNAKPGEFANAKLRNLRAKAGFFPSKWEQSSAF